MDIYTRTMLDDRGQRRPVFVGGMRWWRRSGRERISREQLQGLRGALGARDGLMAGIGVISITLFAMITFSESKAAGGSMVSEVLLVAALTAIMICGAVAGRWRLPTNNAAKIRTVLMTLGHCPSCADRLTDPRSADGCFVCAHCGGAWRPAVTGDYCTCGYDLIRLTPNESGCIQCPECGRSFSATKAWAERYARPVADQHR